MAKERIQRLNARQKKLAGLLPKVRSGELTKTQAIKQAGYADSTAREQSNVLGGIGNNPAMQAALRNVGFNEEFIAGEIHKGATSLPPGKAHLGYVSAGADLLDTFPSKRLSHDITTPVPYAALQSKAAKSADEARRMAEEAEDEDEED